MPPATHCCMIDTSAPHNLSYREAADRIGISERSVRYMVKLGELKHVMWRRRILIPDWVVTEYILSMQLMG